MFLSEGKFEHCVIDNSFADASKSSGTKFELERFFNDKVDRAIFEFQLDIFHVEEFLVLLQESILWFSKDLTQRIPV